MPPGHKKRELGQSQIAEVESERVSERTGKNVPSKAHLLLEPGIGPSILKSYLLCTKNVSGYHLTNLFTPRGGGM